MPFIDIGANLTHAKFKNCLVDVLDDAKKWHVEKIILTGTTLNNTEKSQELSIQYLVDYNLYFTSGVHPHNVKNLIKSDFEKLKILARHPNCVAIGECGLDYNRMFSSKEKQLYWFEEQIKLAINIKKPLFLHERDAEDDFYNLLLKYKKQLALQNIKTVVHCFTGNLTSLKKYLDLECYIGITGWINDNRRNKELVHALQNVEQKELLDKIMIETDCPFLSPIRDDPFNIPSYVYYVLKKLAQVLKIDEKELEKIIYENTCKFFNF